MEKASPTKRSKKSPSAKKSESVPRHPMAGYVKRSLKKAGCERVSVHAANLLAETIEKFVAGIAVAAEVALKEGSKNKKTISNAHVYKALARTESGLTGHVRGGGVAVPETSAIKAAMAKKQKKGKKAAAEAVSA